MAVLNGLQHLLIAAGHIDRGFIDAHTIGFDALRQNVEPWTPERVARVTGVPAADLQAAAAILGTSRSLVSTVLQGVYQSNQCPCVRTPG